LLGGYELQNFTVPGTLPALNEIIKASKSHHMAYANLKKDYTALVMIHAQKLKPVDRADFEITWYCKDRRKDPDNVAGGGLKMLLDGLVKAKILKDDGWSQIGSITHKFEIDKTNPRVEVVLND